MGVDCTLFQKLVALSTRFQVSPKGRSLMLGRHGFVIETQYRQQYETALQAAGKEFNRFDTLQDDGYSENLFRKLGLGEIEAMDFSDFEGASIIHDLNKPVPKKLHNKFEFIFDGGTIEHVFNRPMAFQNVFNMLKVGGRFVSANGMNGWVNHGMYQFGPELIWTYWHGTCGCKIHECLGLQKLPKGTPPLVFPNPADKGERLRLKGQIPEGRVYLYFEAEKLPSSALQEDVLQSDYQVKWEKHEEQKDATT